MLRDVWRVLPLRTGNQHPQGSANVNIFHILIGRHIRNSCRSNRANQRKSDDAGFATPGKNAPGNRKLFWNSNLTSMGAQVLQLAAGEKETGHPGMRTTSHSRLREEVEGRRGSPGEDNHGRQGPTHSSSPGRARPPRPAATTRI